MFQGFKGFKVKLLTAPRSQGLRNLATL